MRSLAALRGWTRRQWLTVLVGGLATAVVIGVPTGVIPTPVFGRSMEVTWWSYPVLLFTSLLAGLLLATYVKVEIAVEVTATARVEDAAPGTTHTPDVEVSAEQCGRLAVAGTALSYFAVGCPVCNKLVLLALGSSGAISWFAPIQPVLAVASIIFLLWALRARLRNSQSCAMPSVAAEVDHRRSTIAP